MADTNNKKNIISCGIFADEIKYLIEKNKWNADPVFLSSSLHVNFSRLEKTLCGTLEKRNMNSSILVYGTCHPNIDKFIENKDILRTSGQNCVELLLGKDVFTDYLSDGAFFLMEDWALRWEEVIPLALGEKAEIISEIFKSEHKYFLGIKTPCSGNFTKEAEDLSNRIGLPLKWHNTGLEHLEESIKLVLSELEKKD